MNLEIIEQNFSRIKTISRALFLNPDPFANKALLSLSPAFIFRTLWDLYQTGLLVPRLGNKDAGSLFCDLN